MLYKSIMLKNRSMAVKYVYLKVRKKCSEFFRNCASSLYYKFNAIKYVQRKKRPSLRMEFQKKKSTKLFQNNCSLKKLIVTTMMHTTWYWFYDFFFNLLVYSMQRRIYLDDINENLAPHKMKWPHYIKKLLLSHNRVM